MDNIFYGGSNTVPCECIPIPLKVTPGQTDPITIVYSGMPPTHYVLKDGYTGTTNCFTWRGSDPLSVFTSSNGKYYYTINSQYSAYVREGCWRYATHT